MTCGATHWCRGWLYSAGGRCHWLHGPTAWRLQVCQGVLLQNGCSCRNVGMGGCMWMAERSVDRVAVGLWPGLCHYRHHRHHRHLPASPITIIITRCRHQICHTHTPFTGVKADVDRSCLILETGVNQRWRYGAWRPSPDSISEAEGWEEAKAGLAGLHFLAVQPDPDSEELTGLWLLLDKLPPNV